jgi:hypothetical protein
MRFVVVWLSGLWYSEFETAGSSVRFVNDQPTNQPTKEITSKLSIEEYFRQHYPTLEKVRNPPTPNPFIFIIKQPNGRVISLPLKKK